jgi:lysophospholipase L1-like esterase
LSKKLILSDNLKILFQGDSITDAGRERNHNESLGDGYVMFTAAWLSALYPEFHLKFLNRGVAGNRVRDLRSRWKKDCLDLRPDLVSILIGVNDIHWKPTSTESFRSDYSSILEQTKQLKSQIVILEPFLVDANGSFLQLYHKLMDKINIIRELAEEFETKLISLNDVFAKASTKRGSSFWTLDGVHPTLVGHALIAQSWIKDVIEDCEGFIR